METFILRPGLRVAVIGGSGHGKTELIAALTRRVGSQPFGQRTVAAPPPEHNRPSYHHPSPPIQHATRLMESPNREYTAVDLVGQRRYLRHAGVLISCVDACLLVVSAAEGVMPITRAHCILARQLTAGSVVAFINRCDQVTDLDQLDLAEMEAREALIDAGFDGDAVTIVRGSARPPVEQTAMWAPALDDLIDALDRGLSDVRCATDQPLVATVMHRWIRPAQPSPVAEVSVRQGVIREAGRLFLVDRYGVTRRVKAVSLRAFDRPAKVIEAGAIGTVALSIHPGSAWAPRRFPRMGDTLLDVEPALVRRVSARVSMISAKRGGRRTAAPHRHEAQLWLLGRDVRCRMLLGEATEALEPGAQRDVTLEFPTPCAVTVGSTGARRDGSDGDVARDPTGANLRSGCFATGQVLSIVAYAE